MGKIKEIRKIEEIREIKPETTIEKVLEQAAPAALNIIKHSDTWRQHQKTHKDAKLEIVGEGNKEVNKIAEESVLFQKPASLGSVNYSSASIAPPSVAHLYGGSHESAAVAASCGCGKIFTVDSVTGAVSSGMEKNTTGYSVSGGKEKKNIYGTSSQEGGVKYK